jgi:sulfur carrier protein ThiS
MSMRIHVKTVGTLKDLEAGTRVEALEVPPGGSVAQVMELLTLQDWEIGFVQINGQRGTRESILKDNDEVTLIAPLVGG